MEYKVRFGLLSLTFFFFFIFGHSADYIEKTDIVKTTLVQQVTDMHEQDVSAHFNPIVPSKPPIHAFSKASPPICPLQVKTLHAHNYPAVWQTGNKITGKDTAYYHFLSVSQAYLHHWP